VRREQVADAPMRNGLTGDAKEIAGGFCAAENLNDVRRFGDLPAHNERLSK